jgi:hypothetical protein
LKAVFKVWPRQKWIPTKIMPHSEEGSFTAEYNFEFSNDKITIKGRGVDRIEFKGDKTFINHVYLSAEKWNDWIMNELKGNK